jgi:amino-acid N-acetyltransferase
LESCLVDHLEDQARQAGIERLFLLTTMAAGFFARLGYRQIERAEVPVAIRHSSAEFEELCPSPARCMAKGL